MRAELAVGFRAEEESKGPETEGLVVESGGAGWLKPGAGIFLTSGLRKNQPFNLRARERLLVKQQCCLCVQLPLVDAHLGRVFHN